MLAWYLERLNAARYLVVRKTCYFSPKLDCTWKTRSHLV